MFKDRPAGDWNGQSWLLEEEIGWGDCACAGGRFVDWNKRQDQKSEHQTDLTRKKDDEKKEEKVVAEIGEHVCGRVGARRPTWRKKINFKDKGQEVDKIKKQNGRIWVEEEMQSKWTVLRGNR